MRTLESLGVWTDGPKVSAWSRLSTRMDSGHFGLVQYGFIGTDACTENQILSMQSKPGCA